LIGAAIQDERTFVMTHARNPFSVVRTGLITAARRQRVPVSALALALVLFNLIAGALLPAPVLASPGNEAFILCLNDGSTGTSPSDDSLPAKDAHDHLCAACLPVTGGPSLLPETGTVLPTPDLKPLSTALGLLSEPAPTIPVLLSARPRGPPSLV
jgi:hypothetical protein